MAVHLSDLGKPNQARPWAELSMVQLSIVSDEPGSAGQLLGFCQPVVIQMRRQSSPKTSFAASSLLWAQVRSWKAQPMTVIALVRLPRLCRCNQWAERPRLGSVRLNLFFKRPSGSTLPHLKQGWAWPFHSRCRLHKSMPLQAHCTSHAVSFRAALNLVDLRPGTLSCVCKPAGDQKAMLLGVRRSEGNALVFAVYLWGIRHSLIMWPKKLV